MSSDTGIYFWDSDNGLVIIVTGRITAAEAYSLHSHVESWIEKHNGCSVFVDLDHTEYVDSTTIGTLIRLHKKQKLLNGRLVLCNLSEPVRKILEQSKLLRYFRIISEEKLRHLEQDAFRRLPMRSKEDMDRSFVLDAHNNICEIVPELRGEFDMLIRVLTDGGDS